MKIYVIGPTGSGKTTLSEHLSKKHKIKCYELDLLVYDDEHDHIKRPDKVREKMFKDILKSPKFKKILEELVCGNSIDTVWIRYLYGMDTTVPATDTVTVSDNNINTDKYIPGPNAPIVTILLSTGEGFSVYQEDIKKWQSLYPSVNVLQELRKMSGWSDANPKKRKSISDIRPFINRWLAAEQDKSTPTAPGTPKNKFNNFEGRNYDMNSLERQMLQT